MPTDSRVQPWKALLDGSPGHPASSNIAQKPSSDTEGFLKGQTILNGGQGGAPVKWSKALYDTSASDSRGRANAPSPERLTPSNATQVPRKHMGGDLHSEMYENLILTSNFRGRGG